MVLEVWLGILGRLTGLPLRCLDRLVLDDQRLAGGVQQVVVAELLTRLAELSPGLLHVVTQNATPRLAHMAIALGSVFVDGQGWFCVRVPRADCDPLLAQLLDVAVPGGDCRDTDVLDYFFFVVVCHFDLLSINVSGMADPAQNPSVRFFIPLATICSSDKQ